MRRVRLVDVAPLVADRLQPFEGTRPYLATGAVSSSGNLQPELISYKTKPTRADLVVKRGDICVARMAQTDKTLLVDERIDDVVLSTGFAVFRPDAAVLDPRFALHWLRTPQFQQRRDALSVGATQRAITNAGIRQLDIPLVPLSEQRRIAAILDTAAAVRTKRSQVSACIDELVRAIFLDLFGDPIANSRGFPVARLGDVADVVTGNSPSRKDAANFGDSIEWIKSDNLGGDVATVAAECLSDVGRARARVAPPGSLLVTCIAGSPASIGKASLVDRAVAFNQQINAVLPSSALDTTFLLGQLKVAPGLVRAKSTGGMKGLVSKSSFQSIEILLPPKNLQREFVRRASRVEGVRRATVEAQASDQELLSSLQGLAFGGEL